jgi:hypothetical protein
VEKDSAGSFTVAGLEFNYTIQDGRRFINGMPAEEFMKTLTPKQLKAILDEAASKSQSDSQ